MLVDFSVLATDESTGAEVVRWVRRFPLMCAPRDYVFSRRSWADGCAQSLFAAFLDDGFL